MKKMNLKTMWVFTLSILMITLLASCTSNDDKKIVMDDKKEMSSDHDSGKAMMTKNYVDYSPEALAEAEWNIVLFFHADWCPSCVAIEKEINKSGLPSDLTVLNVNYDDSDDLKKKYSVLTQTTFVQVDNEWNMIKKWVWARNVDAIVSKLDTSKTMMDDKEVMDDKKEMMKDEEKTMDDKEEVMMDDKEVMDDKKEMIKDEEKMMDDKEEVMMKGEYLDYSSDNLANSKGNTVLFFHATWCPSCAAIEKEIIKWELPSDLTILKVDYDKYNDLKKKYEVLTQTTFVQVDNEWNMIKKWVWAKDIADIESRIK